jgi:hypothetical protein
MVPGLSAGITADCDVTLLAGVPASSSTVLPAGL